MHSFDMYLTAVDTFDIEEFMDLVFPPEWCGIKARILETGAELSEEHCKWAPRWSKIPPTTRGETSSLVDKKIKSIIFRVHDCIHQLWGLPYPGDELTEDNFYYYKRAQMCGEMAVLTLTEFEYGNWVYKTYPEARSTMESRDAVLMLQGPLKGKSIRDVAGRLDDILHRRVSCPPEWVRHNECCQRFVSHYAPMLQYDRDMIDICWKVFQDNPDFVRSLKEMPKAKFGPSLDGLELTQWMIDDFNHLLTSSSDPDWGLIKFNRERRSKIRLPETWPV